MLVYSETWIQRRVRDGDEQPLTEVQLDNSACL